MYAYRYDHSASLPDGYGYHLWTKNINNTGTHYGPYCYRIDITDAPHISTLANDIASVIEHGLDNGELPPELDNLLQYVTVNDIVAELNPSNIVDSGGTWDNPDIACWLWDCYFDAHNIDIVQTDDGAISYSQANIRAERVEEKE